MNYSVNVQLKAWAGLARLPFHSVSIMPFILGIVLAWAQDYQVNWPVAVLSGVVVLLIMLVTYFSGEYFDFEVDSINKDYNKFSGGSRVLQTGAVNRKSVIIATYVALAVAAVLGLSIYFIFKTGPFTIPLGIFGAFCGYFYSSKPFQWSYRGIGEVIIGICYGWLTVNTGYYLQTGRFDLTASLISIPIAISIFLVILINEFPDYAADKAMGKKNLVVRFGKEKMGIWTFWLLITCYLSFFLSYFSGVPLLWLAIFSLIPVDFIVVNAVAIARKRYNDKIALEAICARMILINLLITISLIATFVVNKWMTG
jgi:1,4-dihydroxy-2-naphthoate octaprenyltransferase